MDLSTLRAWIEAAGCSATPAQDGTPTKRMSIPTFEAKTLRIRPNAVGTESADDSLPPFFAQLTDNWVLFSMLPMLEAGEDRPDHLGQRLLAANREMRLAKFALDAQGSVILCAELPTESLDASEVADCVRRILAYARRFRSSI